MSTNPSQIEIAPSKLDGYLLNKSHPTGRSKAECFRSAGITHAQALRSLLLNLSESNEATETVSTEFGVKYIVDGPLQKSAFPHLLRTVWIVLHGENSCKFVTAYPL